MKKPIYKISIAPIIFIISMSVIIGCKTEDEVVNPCQGLTQVTYEGTIYHMIEIGSQCWLKENLNLGTMIDSLENMKDNGIIEKYCYRNKEDNCTKYGGLYQWDEMMQYATQQGVRGICPPDWHVPTDEEWKVLEGTVDSQYGVGDPEWDIIDTIRGDDAGKNLKTTSGWNENGNGTDLFGFSCLPGGARYSMGYFDAIGLSGYFWMSTETEDLNAWLRVIVYHSPGIGPGFAEKKFGFSVRCLRDN